MRTRIRSSRVVHAARRFVALAHLSMCRIGPSGRRSGSLVFPAPSATLPVAGWSSRCSVARPLEPSRRKILANPSPTLHFGAIPIALVETDLLSVHVRMVRHACRAMRLSPLHRHAPEASTPATTACRRFGPEGSTLEVPFRPCGFAPLRRLPPLLESRACCIPLPVLGSAVFPLRPYRSEDR